MFYISPTLTRHNPEHRRSRPHRQGLRIRRRGRLRPRTPLRQGLLRFPVRSREATRQLPVVIFSSRKGREDDGSADKRSCLSTSFGAFRIRRFSAKNLYGSRKGERRCYILMPRNRNVASVQRQRHLVNKASFDEVARFGGIAYLRPKIRPDREDGYRDGDMRSRVRRETSRARRWMFSMGRRLESHDHSLQFPSSFLCANEKSIKAASRYVTAMAWPNCTNPPTLIYACWSPLFTKQSNARIPPLFGHLASCAQPLHFVGNMTERPAGWTTNNAHTRRITPNSQMTHL